jgi:diadenosine tetraphosphate (Ap4A) HIT family hydrolase
MNHDNMNQASASPFELHTDLQRDGILLGQFELCLVLLINDRSYPWFVLVPQRAAIRDTIDLESADYRQLWEESKIFGTAIMQIFAGEKLNVAALGNVTPQLHVHHVVRHSHDPAWPAPIWGKQPLQSYSALETENVRQHLSDVAILGFRIHRPDR